MNCVTDASVQRDWTRRAGGSSFIKQEGLLNLKIRPAGVTSKRAVPEVGGCA